MVMTKSLHEAHIIDIIAMDNPKVTPRLLITTYRNAFGEKALADFRKRLSGMKLFNKGGVVKARKGALIVGKGGKKILTAFLNAKPKPRSRAKKK